MMMSPRDSLGDPNLPPENPISDIAKLPTPKRRKVDVACNVCKSRKSKCDGVRPVCGPCAMRWGGQNACAYRLMEPNFPPLLTDSTARDGLINRAPPSSKSSNKQTPPSRQYAYSSISEPLAKYSYNIYDNAGNIQPLQRASAGQDILISNEDSAGFRFQMGTSQIEPINLYGGKARVSPAESDRSDEERNVDAMGCVDGWALRAGLLGLSSGASFMRLMRKAAEETDTPDQREKSTWSGQVHATLPRLRRESHKAGETDPHDAQLVLPPRKTADHLITVYWNYSDIIFPFLDRSEITEIYEGLWTGNDQPMLDEKVFHATLNLMFAIACKLDSAGKPEEQSKTSDVYYKRARKLLSFDLLDISQFQLIQTLLLSAQYLQSTNMPRKCLQSIGMAILIAQDIRLHLPQTTEAIADQHDRELARRVWHGCILMDKIAAMTYGRPLQISQESAAQARLPLVTEVGNSSGPEQHCSSQPAKLDFFIAYCKLHYILGEILSALYATGEEPPQYGVAGPNAKLFTEHMQKLFEIDRKLIEWRGSLKAHLQVPSQYDDQTETRHFRRQANILYARYLHLRILLFRPSFSQTHRLTDIASDPDGTSLESQSKSLIVSQCRVLCVQTARQIIELIFTNLLNPPNDNHFVVLPTWWYNISYVYMSATVLIAAHMFPMVLERVPSSVLMVQLQQAFDVLRYYETHTEFAARCKSALEGVYEKILSRKELNSVPTESMAQQSRANFGLSTEVDRSMLVNDINDIPVFDLVEGQDLALLDGGFFDWDDTFWE